MLFFLIFYLNIFINVKHFFDSRIVENNIEIHNFDLGVNNKLQLCNSYLLCFCVVTIISWVRDYTCNILSSVLNTHFSVLAYKRYSRSAKTEKEDLNALRMPPRDQTRINRSPICERTCCPSTIKDPPSMASLSGCGAGSLYQESLLAELPAMKGKRKELVDLSAAVSRTTKSRRRDFTRDSLFSFPDPSFLSCLPLSSPRQPPPLLHSEKGRRLAPPTWVRGSQSRSALLF